MHPIRIRDVILWVGVAAAILVPLAAAALSPLLAWRNPVYIIAGFAGVAAMALLLLQPLLAAGLLPGMRGPRGRRAHRLVGATLVAAVALHVAGLWVTSPPDVVDALMFRSPTPFSVWGVIAMWSLFSTALLAALRGPLRLGPRFWRMAHTGLAAIIVIGCVIHAVLIEGTMESVSKIVLAALVLTVTAWVVAGTWLRRRGRG